MVIPIMSVSKINGQIKVFKNEDVIKLLKVRRELCLKSLRTK